MVRSRSSLVCIALLAAAELAAQTTPAPSRPELAAQVFAAESAFARTMADRDFAAFGTFVSAEAVFFGREVQRGREAVLANWRRFYEGPRAPFSWLPEIVEVLESGTLALSSGPVRDPNGVQTGTFTSIWRRDADGRWRVVFDKGCSCRASGGN